MKYVLLVFLTILISCRISDRHAQFRQRQSERRMAEALAISQQLLIYSIDSCIAISLKLKENPATYCSLELLEEK